MIFIVPQRDPKETKIMSYQLGLPDESFKFKIKHLMTFAY